MHGDRTQQSPNAITQQEHEEIVAPPNTTADTSQDIPQPPATSDAQVQLETDMDVEDTNPEIPRIHDQDSHHQTAPNQPNNITLETSTALLEQECDLQYAPQDPSALTIIAPFHTK